MKRVYFEENANFKMRLKLLSVKRMTKYLLLMLATSVVFQTLCHAEFTGSITGTTEYIGYGYTKSNGEPALQANLDYQHASGLFLGVSVSSVDFGDHQFKDRSRVEIAPYLGGHFEFSDDWRFELQWLRYLYDDRIFGADADYNLFSATVHYQDLVSAQITVSDDVYQQDEMAVYYQLTGRYPLTDRVEFSSILGYSSTRDALEYNYLYWHAGLTWFHPYGAVDFRYVQSTFISETERANRTRWLFDPDKISARFVFSVSFGF